MTLCISRNRHILQFVGSSSSSDSIRGIAFSHRSGRSMSRVSNFAKSLLGKVS